MTMYEELLIEAEKLGIRIKEIDFGIDAEIGYYCNNKILINNRLSERQKYIVLAEEIGHHKTTVGDITNQTKLENKKQEIKARRYGYTFLLEPIDLIYAFRKGAKNRFEIAEYLDITEKVFDEAISCFKCQYGIGRQFGDYYIGFEPNLHFIKLLK